MYNGRRTVVVCLRRDKIAAVKLYAPSVNNRSVCDERQEDWALSCFKCTQQSPLCPVVRRRKLILKSAVYPPC